MVIAGEHVVGQGDAGRVDKARNKACLHQPRWQLGYDVVACLRSEVVVFQLLLCYMEFPTDG